MKPNGKQHDTQLMWHAICPELACSKLVGKSLALLTSLFTNENYYKDELKSWKKVADWNAFYRYNARDSAVTYEIYQVLDRQLDNKGLRDVYDFEQSLIEPYKNATILGLRIDTRMKGSKA